MARRYPQSMELVDKYPSLLAAIARPDSELRTDLEHALGISAADPHSEIGVRAGKVPLDRASTADAHAWAQRSPDLTRALIGPWLAASRRSGPRKEALESVLGEHPS